MLQVSNLAADTVKLVLIHCLFLSFSNAGVNHLLAIGM